MDIEVRYFDNDKNQVESRYITSVFMGCEIADDLLWHFKDGLKELDMKNINSISMDCPNINWSLLTKFQDDLDVNYPGLKLLSLGSCGLHVMPSSGLGIKNTMECQ